MSQHDFDIANATASVARADINGALKALGSLSSGSSAPATTYANMLWYDTGTNILKMRSEANDQWIDIGYLDQGSGTFEVAGITNAAIISAIGFTPVQQGGGSGQLGNKVYIGWDGGGLKAQVDASDRGRIAFESILLGLGQTWQNVGRASGVAYQNTTGRPIMFSFRGNSAPLLRVSSNGSSYVTVGTSDADGSTRDTLCAIIPAGHFYIADDIRDTVVELR